MKVTLPREVIDSLPQADSQGLVRVQASIRLGADGSAEIVEINDSPVPSEGETDDANPMPEMPDLSGEEFY